MYAYKSNIGNPRILGVLKHWLFKLDSFVLLARVKVKHISLVEEIKSNCQMDTSTLRDRPAPSDQTVKALRSRHGNDARIPHD